ncbi:sulfotransferase family 2 domain-containing protein [Nocardioides bigeumensis]|uniref:Sulfotransferase family 2 domain-containing protein n=1 Tax=Nocardioides bigeumensis TaxID=433657 RepID=A0ABP5KP35_9ACTN
MIVSDSARVLFVHVQKTGGLTVQDLLRHALPDAVPVQGLGGGRHARLGAALKVRPELRDYFVFGFVRNPWARMWSWYSMVQRRREAVEAGSEFMTEKLGRNQFWAKVMTDFPDFETFVLQGSDEVKRLRTPQVRYLRAPGRRADFVGKTENLEADVREVFGRLGLSLPGEIPRNNAGPPDDYRTHYTPVARERVAELFDQDVRAFGYSF